MRSLKLSEIICIIILSSFMILALLGYLITPDRTRYCNTQLPEIAFLNPLNKACFAKNYLIPFETSLDAITGIPHYERPVLVENESTVKRCHLFILGTDRFGRDLLSRLIIGMRYTLIISFFAVLFAVIIGVTLGSLSGYFGGRTDRAINFAIGVFWSLPSILFAFVIILAAGKNIGALFVSIGITIWADMAKLVRGLVMAQKESNYVRSATALGFSPARILFIEILPNISGPILVQASSNFALAILLESGLSFMGLGLQPPTPTLGNIMQDQYTQAFNGQIIQSLIPAIVLVLLILSFQIVANTVRDRMDVKLSRD